MSEAREKWKDIQGYEGLYQVSDLGRIKSIGRTIEYANGTLHPYQEKIRKNNTHKNGYKNVDLWKEGKAKTFKVHRLVAQAFVPNPNNLPEVNHIDENKENNKASNLEWVTAEYNTNYGTRGKRAGEKRKKPVLQFALDGNFIKEHTSAKEAAKQFGNKHIAMQIGECCRGTQKTAHGFKWRFKEEVK